MAARPHTNRFTRGGGSGSGGSAVPAAAGAAAAVPAAAKAAEPQPANPMGPTDQATIEAQLRHQFAQERAARPPTDMAMPLDVWQQQQMGLQPKSRAPRPQPGAPRTQMTQQEERAWREANNQQSDQAIGRYVRQNFQHGWLPAAAFTPPPAVREHGIHVQPQRNPWESLVEAGVPASPRGDADAARRNQEMDRYMSHFKGHPSVRATRLAAPAYGPNNPPPPPAETPPSSQFHP